MKNKVYHINYRLITTLTSDSLRYFKKVNPDDAKLMENTKFVRRTKEDGKKQINLFEKVQNFRRNSYEKRILCDPQVANDIIKKIRENSDAKDALNNVPFIDGEGGLCLVGRKWIESNGSNSNSPVILFQGYSDFDPIVEEIFKNRNNNVVLENENVIGSSQKVKIGQGEVHELHFYARTLDFRNEWRNPIPGYICYAIAPIFYLRFLANQVMAALTPNCQSHDTLFYKIRPEFFLLVNAKDCAHALNKVEKFQFRYRQTYNYIIQSLFDIKVLEAYETKSLLPWHNSKPSKLYDFSKIHLLKLRPKKNIPIDNFDLFKPEWLIHLAETITTLPHHSRFLPIIDKLVPYVGHDLIKDADFSVMTTLGDVKPNMLLPIYNIMVKQKDFKVSPFITSAQLSKKSREESDIENNEEYTEKV